MNPQRRSWSQYAQLIAFTVYVDLKTEIKKMRLGWLWWFLDPVFFISIYSLVFTVFLDTKTPRFIVFLSIGIVFWRWLSTTVHRSCHCIQAQARVMQEISIPKFIFPITIFLADTCKMLTIFLCLFIFLAFHHIFPTVLWLTLLPNFVCQGILILGLSFCCAYLTPFFPDFLRLLPTLLFGWMIMSGVLFNILTTPVAWVKKLQYNPMADILINYRLPLLEQQPPQWGYMLYSASVGVLLNVIGILLIWRYNRRFPGLPQL